MVYYDIITYLVITESTYLFATYSHGKFKGFAFETLTN